MEAIVSLLDSTHTVIIEKIWEELRTKFGLHGVYRTPFPHISYVVAEQFPPSPFLQRLPAIAQASSPFRAVASGLGIFPGATPVLYIPVVRSRPLDRLHERIWRACIDQAVAVSEYYHPGRWLPHITIAHHDLGFDRIGAIIDHVARRNIHCDIPIDNIVHIADVHGQQICREPIRLLPV